MNTPASVVSMHNSSPLAPRIAIWSTLACAAIILLLHVAKPDFAPSWRFISEYSIGEHGWLMMLAFFVWAVSCFALAAAVWPHVHALHGRIGIGLLVLVGLSLIGAGLFTADPITAKPDELTREGNLHGVSAMVGIPGFPLAAVLIARSLHLNPAWRAVRRSVVVAALATFGTVVAMSMYIPITLAKTGGFGPDTPVGWLNRLVVLSFLTWQIVVALGALRVSRASAK
jgi:hypothetical protein